MKIYDPVTEKEHVLEFDRYMDREQEDSDIVREHAIPVEEEERPSKSGGVLVWLQIREMCIHGDISALWFVRN